MLMQSSQDQLVARSQEPPELGHAWPIPQLGCWHVSGVGLEAGLPVPPCIVPDHVGTRQGSDERAGRTEHSRRDQGGLVLRRLLLDENVAAHKTHQVCQWHANRRHCDTLVLVRDVVAEVQG